MDCGMPSIPNQLPNYPITQSPNRMTPSLRRFLQTLSAGALAAGMPRWTYARTFDSSREQAPAVRDPKYREWSAAALAAAKKLGCSYADIRFTRNRTQNI